MGSGLMLPFAALTGIAMALPMPVAAADVSVPASKSSAIRATQATRHAASHDGDRRLSSIRNNLECSGTWCGRQFVLMVGVAY